MVKNHDRWAENRLEIADANKPKKETAYQHCGIISEAGDVHEKRVKREIFDRISTSMSKKRENILNCVSALSLRLKQNDACGRWGTGIVCVQEVKEWCGQWDAGRVCIQREKNCGEEGRNADGAPAWGVLSAELKVEGSSTWLQQPRTMGRLRPGIEVGTGERMLKPDVLLGNVCEWNSAHWVEPGEDQHQLCQRIGDTHQEDLNGLARINIDCVSTSMICTKQEVDCVSASTWGITARTPTVSAHWWSIRKRFWVLARRYALTWQGDMHWISSKMVMHWGRTLW